MKLQILTLKYRLINFSKVKLKLYFDCPAIFNLINSYGLKTYDNINDIEFLQVDSFNEAIPEEIKPAADYFQWKNCKSQLDDYDIISSRNFSN